jgi:high-affinity Fe2+/Pb2+ permease
LVKGDAVNSFASAALSLAMLAAIVLIVGGAKLAMKRESRNRGVLMIAAAAVLVMNVMIWTV